ncbi:carotenoid oxygenase [Paraphysoderma sedebokerense]|nr:carotenoid oxygenase [Paraphysoderma sedebokerense]
MPSKVTSSDISSPLLKPTPSNALPHHSNEFLSGNFAPVQVEYNLTLIQSVDVEGKIPDCFYGGEYIRNSPNPQFVEKSMPYHWFDGDGMLHGIYFDAEGRPHYVNKYVKTPRFSLEKSFGGKIYGSIARFMGESKWDLMKSLIAMYFARFFDTPAGHQGTANTALAYHAKRLYATNESDCPVQVIAPSLDTLGIQTFDDALLDDISSKMVTAHPKIDAETGEMIFFGYRLEKHPHIHYSVADRENKLIVKKLPLSKCRAAMYHDFFITKNYSCIMDMPLLFDPEKAFKSKKPDVFKFYPSEPSRFAFLPRHAASEASAIWIEMDEPCYIFHTANAWEEDRDGQLHIIMLGCRAKHVDLGLKVKYDVGKLNSEEIKAMKDTQAILSLFDFNLNSKTVDVTPLVKIPGEFPTINFDFAMKPNQFTYYGTFAEDGSILMHGIAKYDHKTGKTKVYSHGNSVYGGEAVFVPNTSIPLKRRKEDDGYLTLFVFDEVNKTSQLRIVDAKTMSESARITVPFRVPYGFHGIWVDKSDVETQDKSANGVLSGAYIKPTIDSWLKRAAAGIAWFLNK